MLNYRVSQLFVALVAVFVAAASVTAPAAANGRSQGRSAGIGPDMSVHRPAAAVPVPSSTTTDRSSVPVREPAIRPGRLGGELDSHGGSVERFTNSAHGVEVFETVSNSMRVIIRVRIHQGDGASLTRRPSAPEQIIVHWGDGTTDTFDPSGVLGFGHREFSFAHTYPYEDGDTQLDYRVHAVIRDGLGNESADRADITLEPRYDVRYSPLTFRPLTKCDNPLGFQNPGEFYARWVHDGELRGATARLKRGQRKTVSAFSALIEDVGVGDVDRPVDIAESDSILSWLLPWNWMMRYEPKVDGIARPYTLGWHQYSYVETGAGDVLFSEKGDRDCKIRVSYARHISLR